ncbi:DUF2913 family protein [Shewanella rhizosphaerae]|uniref:DUF2913 family protein n=1 Tax=Shewanella rhizosphaerae TaxID=2864207 RepID=UPI001C65A9A2|nr:DUF2913 family protein [Shewanella rhizosphaerae]QYK13855.1 DUF2913 family protein [Shewanella rhizosphaerae]
MTEQSYNQALVALAQAGLADLAARNANPGSIKTPAAESHFLCNWMVQSLKERRFSKLVADDLTRWIREGRSKGAGAQLPQLLQRIENQYLPAMENAEVGQSLQALIADLEAQGWLVILDCEVSGKLRLDSDGQNSLVISVEQYEQHLVEGKLIKSITLYMRADEQLIAQYAVKHALLLSQGDKKASCIKHHKAYRLYPGNRQPALALLKA